MFSPFCYLRICTMAAKFVGFIYPPAHPIIWMITRIIICATADFTNSVHNYFL